MRTRLPLHRLIPLGASCLMHVALASAAVALGLEMVAPKELRVLLAELVPAESDAAKPSLKSAPSSHHSFTLPKPTMTLRARTSRVEPAAEQVRPPEPVATAPSVKPEAPPETEAPRVPAPSGAQPSRDPAPTPSAPSTFAAVSDFGGATEPATRGVRPVDASPTSGRSTAMATPSDITQAAIPRGGYQVRPTYPGSARRLGIQGTTTLRIYVAADGLVGDILIEQSAGHPDLDHAAADAVKRWTFEPARRGAQPVGMWVLLPVEFRLK